MLLIDVDGTLMNRQTNTYIAKTGFTDWVTLPDDTPPFVAPHSPEMIAMLEAYFGDEMYWLSDWIMSSASQILLPKYLPLTREYQDFARLIEDQFMSDEPDTGPGLLLYPKGTWGNASVFGDQKSPTVRGLLAARWWKLNCVAYGVYANLLPGKVVWIDSDINRFRADINIVLKDLGVQKRFRLISTYPCVYKKELEDAYKWLYE